MKFLILAISYKYGGLCVAGIDLDDYKYVRLCSEDIATKGAISPKTLNIRRNNANYQLHILDVIDIDVRKQPDNGCQTENFTLIKINHFLQTYSVADLDNLYKNHIMERDLIFGNTSYRFDNVIADSLDYSLILCQVNNFSVDAIPCDEKIKLKASFIYKGRSYSNISVTDCVFCNYPKEYASGTMKTCHNQTAIIMLSIPYDDWSIANGFFKYVSGIVLKKL